MKVDVKMARSFNKAVSNPENIQSNGHVNWNFVDADIHLDNAELKLGFTSQQLFNELESFNEEAELYIS